MSFWRPINPFWKRRRYPKGWELDRPVFVVGCCKSGTTLLSSLMLQHPDLGPKHELVQGEESPQAKASRLLNDDQFNVLAHEVEQKEIWDRYFPMQGVKLRMGIELRLLENSLTRQQQVELVEALTADLVEPRFFSKHPANLYRLHPLREMFPDARFVGIHRDGRDVIASWGRKGNRWRQFGGYASAIETFGTKWSDAVEHLERYRESLGVHMCRYEELVQQPDRVLREVFEFCELSPQPAVGEALALRCEPDLWRSRVPVEFHPQVEAVTAKMREQLGYSQPDEA
jgi:hypothetical protein